MALDAELLDQARAAEARVIDAERDVDVARAEFHRLVRQLQLAGGSLREIADALGLSHQRVHQIVEDAGGARPWRSRVLRRRPDAETMPEADLACSFCGKHQPAMNPKLIAGPGVYICHDCVDLADQVISTRKPAATPLSSVSPIGEDAAAAKCSFCGKRRAQAKGMAAAAKVTICSECIALCHEIIAEKLTT